MSKSAVSKHVGRLEDRLGARLLNRTTRRLSLTEVGRVYYEHCARILHEAEEGDLAVGRLQEEPRGTLRINAPMSFGQIHVAPALPDFLTAYPDLSVDVTFEDRFVDAVEEGYDVLIRIGSLADSSLIARKLAWSEAQICASPAYWEKHGMPQHPRDLLEHNCLNYTYLSTNNEWRFVNKDEPGEITSVRVSGNIRANNSPVQREAALAGIGVARLPHFVICDDIRAGPPGSRADRLSAAAVRDLCRLSPQPPPVGQGAGLRRFLRRPGQVPARPERQAVARLPCRPDGTGTDGRCLWQRPQWQPSQQQKTPPVPDGVF